MEITRFALVGATTVIIDLIFYKSLLYANFDLNWAKGLSFIIGSLFAYFANKRITFLIKSNNFNKIFFFAAVYSFGLLINVVINSSLLKVMYNFEYKIMICFFISTFFSALSNYIGMKFFVFNVANR